MVPDRQKKRMDGRKDRRNGRTDDAKTISRVFKPNFYLGSSNYPQNRIILLTTKMLEERETIDL